MDGRGSTDPSTDPSMEGRRWTRVVGRGWMDEDGWTRMVGRGWLSAVSSICCDSIVVWFEWLACRPKRGWCGKGGQGGLGGLVR